MPETVEQTPAAETPAFDQAAWMKARNEGTATPGRPAPAPAPAAAAPAPAAILDDDDDTADHETAPRLSRSQRREMNRLREDAAEARGRLEAYKELAAKPAAAAPAPAARQDTEPDREAFDSDAAYLKALAKFEAAKLFRQSQTEAADNAKWGEFRQIVATNTDKFHEDVKLFPDWEKAQEAIEDIIVDTDKQSTFVSLLGQSDVRAAVTYHFATHRPEFEAFLKLPPDRQISAFHRLEGRVEAKQLEAAQASGTATGKTAATAEKPAQGATAADRDVRKPRPSTEVAARGGTPPPDEPAIGSAAWMAKRNAAQYAK